MKKTIMLLVCVLFAFPVSAWELKETVDAMTDKISRTVFVKSNDGSRFTLARKSNKKVWGYLELNGMNQFMINERLMLRVDKNDPRKFNEDMEKMNREFGLDWESWEWNPSLIGFLVWHGLPNEGCGLVQQLYDGTKMVIRYHPNQSTIKDIHFDISKNKLAIPVALGFEMDNCSK